MECLARVLSVELSSMEEGSTTVLMRRIFDMLERGGAAMLHALLILRLAAHAQQALAGNDVCARPYFQSFGAS